MNLLGIVLAGSDKHIVRSYHGGQDMKCHYCDETNDLRPYGPKGTMVCFSCATATPEREAETKRNFAVQLDAAGPLALLDGTEIGPYPAEHNPDVMRMLGCKLSQTNSGN